MNKKVTIVIPVYNGENYMREAIDSALAQTYKNIEVIVVNDGSTDNTDEIALSYGDKIRYFKKENGGVSTALNLALDKMTGEYFSWCSHDDIYCPDKIEKQMDFLQTLNDDNVIIFNNYGLINSDGKDFKNNVCFDHDLLTKKPKLALLNGNINGITLLIPKKAFDEIGRFDVDLRCTQDYDMWLRMIKTYTFVHMKDVITKTRIHQMQDTQTSPRMVTEGNKLWIRIIDSIDDKEKVELNGSIFEYYYQFAFLLKDTPYNEALNYAIIKCLEINENEYLKKDVRKMKKNIIKRGINSIMNFGLLNTIKKIPYKLKKKIL